MRPMNTGARTTPSRPQVSQPLGDRNGSLQGYLTVYQSSLEQHTLWHNQLIRDSPDIEVEDIVGKGFSTSHSPPHHCNPHHGLCNLPVKIFRGIVGA